MESLTSRLIFAFVEYEDSEHSTLASAKRKIEREKGKYDDDVEMIAEEKAFNKKIKDKLAPFQRFWSHKSEHVGLHHRLRL